jgi:invasion protein IalB
MKNQMKILAMNTRRTFGRLIPVVALLALTAIPAAAQQAAAPAAAAPEAGATTLPIWVKTCDVDKATKKEICLITQELRADSGTFIASAAIVRVTGDKKYSLRVTVPNGLILKPGVKAQIDTGTSVSLIYLICELHACLAGADIDDTFIESMKTGKTFGLTGYNQQAKPVNFAMPLSGFAGALAGKALDPEGFKKLQDARIEAFKAKAEQARDAMLKAQRDQAGGAAPAQ